MSSTDLRQLINDATAELPPSVSQPPLAAIHHRVRRNRTRMAAVLAAVVALIAMGVTLPLLNRHDGRPPATEPTQAGQRKIVWQFGYVDKGKLKIYAIEIEKCTVLAGKRTEVTMSGNVTTVSFIATPERDNACNHVDHASAELTLPAGAAGSLINDGSNGRPRPVYDRAELPREIAGGVASMFSIGAGSHNGEPLEFWGEVQTQKSVSPPQGIVGIEFRGTGLTDQPLSTLDGESMTVGSKLGVLVQYRKDPERADRYKFVWQEPRGSQWIRYELFIDRPTPREETIEVLNLLVWS